MRYILKLGPMPSDRGETSFYLSYLHPLGEDDEAPMEVPFEARTDLEGVRVLMARSSGPTVCEPVLAAAAAELGLEVREPPEELHEARAHLALMLSNEVDDEADVALADFFHVYTDFVARRPWEDVPADEVLKVQLTRPQRTWEARLRGSDGAGPSLDLTAERGFFAQLIAAERAGDSSRVDELWASSTQWTLSLEQAEPWCEDALVRATGSPEAPALERFVKGEPAPWSRDDVLLMTATLDGLLRLVDGEEGKGYGSDEAHEVTALVARGGPVTAPAPAKKAVGRNDPCPCGSGQKFKKCHEGQPLPSPGDRD